MRSPIPHAVVASVAAGLALLGCAAPANQDPIASEGAAREFIAMTTDGTEISGESLLGHVTIVDFWAVF
jgi:hypothetical protein